MHISRSTLRGTFSNFSATFQYKGPIDDARLSLIESVNIFELNHMVRVTGENPAMPALGYIDDGLDDFLANVRPDTFYLPDTVFTSDSRASNYSVSSIIDKATFRVISYNDDDTVELLVHHNLTAEEIGLLNDWVYIRFNNPLDGTDYKLLTATRLDVNYTLIPQRNSWQTSWVEYLKNGTIDNQDHIHLFDYLVASSYLLVFGKQAPVTNLRITDQSNHSLTVAWEYAPGASSSYVFAKPTELPDSYYKVAKSFTQINSVVIRNLQSGIDYDIKVFTGDKGNYESTGALVTGSTLGQSFCGNGLVDEGEECDDGVLLNGSPENNCTEPCLTAVTSSRQEGDDDDDDDEPSPTSPSQPTESPVTPTPTSPSQPTESPVTLTPTSPSSPTDAPNSAPSASSGTPTSLSSPTDSPVAPSSPPVVNNSPSLEPSAGPSGDSPLTSLGGATASICHRSEFECGSLYQGHTMHKRLENGECMARCAYFVNFRLQMGWRCGPCDEEGTRYLLQESNIESSSGEVTNTFLRH